MSDSDATVSVRLIRSFEYKTFRTIVLTHLDLHATTLSALTVLIRQKLEEAAALAFLRSVPFDTFKIHAYAHGAKTSNTIISTSSDSTLILRDYEKALWEAGLRHESELSWFVMEDYLRYKAAPVTKWE